MPYSIPKEGRKSLADLLKQTPAFLDALYTALKDCDAQLMPRSSREVAAKLEGFGVDDSTLMGFLTMLNGVLAGAEDDSAEKIAAELISSAQATTDKELSAGASGWSIVRTFLTKTFALEKLRASARALGLFSDTPRHLHGARILTDARPVFSKDAAADPIGFVIIHTLRLDYFEDGDSKEWYVALDLSDLEELKTSVDRAIKKQKSLKQFLKRSQTPVFTPYEGSDEAKS